MPVVGVGRLLPSDNAVFKKVIRLEKADRSSSVEAALKGSLGRGGTADGKDGYYGGPWEASGLVMGNFFAFDTRWNFFAYAIFQIF